MLYSDTDSVYVGCPNDMSIDKVYEIKNKVAELWCDDYQIGKCKFETADDIGHDYATHMAIISPKFYGLYSKHTG